MNDYLVDRPVEVRIEAATPVWRRGYPLFAVEVALAWISVGWSAIGIYTGIGHPASPAGNAFVAAAQFVGSWAVLVTLLLVAAFSSVAGILTDRRKLRKLGLGLGAFNFGFIAAGLSTLGLVSTAVVVYPVISVLAIAAYLALPESRRAR